MRKSSPRGGQPAKASEETRRSGDDRREAIAAAALQLFAEVGYDNVTNKDLGRAANIAPGLIYYYFKDKDDLFRYVLRKSLQDMLARYAELKGERSGEDLDAWIASNLSLSRPTSGFLKIILDYAMSSRRSAETDIAIREFYTHETTILVKALGRRANAAQLAILISVFLDGLIASRIVRPELDAESLVDLLQTLIGTRTRR